MRFGQQPAHMFSLKITCIACFFFCCFFFLLPPPRRLCFSCPFVGWIIQISMKFGWGTNLGPQWTPSTFGADPGFFFFLRSFFNIAKQDIFRNFSEDNDEKKKQTYLGAGIYEWLWKGIFLEAFCCSVWRMACMETYCLKLNRHGTIPSHRVTEAVFASCLSAAKQHSRVRANSNVWLKILRAPLIHFTSPAHKPRQRVR